MTSGHQAYETIIRRRTGLLRRTAATRVDKAIGCLWIAVGCVFVLGTVILSAEAVARM